jgi:hypothetical protein
MLPTGGSPDLLLPERGEVGHLGGDGRILDRVGELAALGEGAEAVVILAGKLHVIRIESEVRVDWRVVADPRKSAQPRIVGGDSGQLDVCGSSEKRALSDEHAEGEGQKEREPTPDARAQQLFSDQAAAEERHEDVDQVQVAHGLHRGETNKGRGEQHDAGGQELESCKNGGACGQFRHDGTVGAAGVAGDEPEDEDGGDGAEPLVPGPA